MANIGHTDQATDGCMVCAGAPKPDSAVSSDDRIAGSAAADSVPKTREVLLTGQDLGGQPDSSSLPQAPGHSDCDMSLPAEALSNPVSLEGKTHEAPARPEAIVASQEQEPASQKSLPLTQSAPQAEAVEPDAAAAPEEGAEAEPPADVPTAADEPIANTAAASALTGADSGTPESAREQPDAAQAGPQEAEPAIASSDPSQPSQQQHAHWKSHAAMHDNLPHVPEPAAEIGFVMPLDSAADPQSVSVGEHADPVIAEVSAGQAKQQPKSMLSRFQGSVSAFLHSQPSSMPDHSIDEGSEEDVKRDVVLGSEVPEWRSPSQAQLSKAVLGSELQTDSLPSSSAGDPSLSHDSQMLDSDSPAVAESPQTGSQDSAETKPETQHSLISRLPLTALYTALAAAAIALLACLAARHMGSAAQHMHQAAAGHALADAMQRMSITPEMDVAALTVTPVRTQPAEAADAGVGSGAPMGGRSRKPRNRELASLGEPHLTIDTAWHHCLVAPAFAL